MTYKYFLHNGEILPSDQAAVPLDSIEYSYGFGVYETVRLSGGHTYFLAEHSQRLMSSAVAIGLDHGFTPARIKSWVEQLTAANQTKDCNFKILLIGGQDKASANLYILCLNPLYPDRKLYREGAACVTVSYERDYPQAKTLNMLPSYLAYRKARHAGAYDALLIDREGCVTEGTRTNFLAIDGQTVVSPPSSAILPGVARANVLKVARRIGYKIVEQNIPLEQIRHFDSVCLTSTSSKIMPLKSVDEITWPAPSPALKRLMEAYDEFLAGVRVTKS